MGNALKLLSVVFVSFNILHPHFFFSNIGNPQPFHPLLNPKPKLKITRDWTLDMHKPNSIEDAPNMYDQKELQERTAALTAAAKKKVTKKKKSSGSSSSSSSSSDSDSGILKKRKRKSRSKKKKKKKIKEEDLQWDEAPPPPPKGKA